MLPTQGLNAVHQFTLSSFGKQVFHIEINQSKLTHNDIENQLVPNLPNKSLHKCLKYLNTSQDSYLIIISHVL